MTGLHKEAPSRYQNKWLEVSPQAIEVEKDLQDLAALQTQCENALGIDHDPQDLLKRSYNPVTDRWHVERLRRAGDVCGLEAFRKGLWNDQKTNLMERLHAVESYGEFTIIGGELYSEDFPEKQFGEIILRGAIDRARLGSSEQEREGWLGELTGWEYVNAIMVHPHNPVGTTVISFSPPGIDQETAYTGRYVDTYTLAETREVRYIKRARIAVDWEYDDYRKAALLFNPRYFETYDGRPEDAWFLSHPIIANKDIFQASSTGMVSSEFYSIFKHPSLQRLIRQYEKNVFAEVVNWFELACSFNAILNCADELKQELIAVKKPQKAAGAISVHQIAAMDESSFHAAVYLLGARPVQAVGGGGCPTNRGINLSSMLTGGLGGLGGDGGILSNSVAKFGLASETCNKISCKRCNWEASDDEIEKIQEGKLTTCPKCGWSPG